MVIEDLRVADSNSAVRVKSGVAQLVEQQTGESLSVTNICL